MSNLPECFYVPVALGADGKQYIPETDLDVTTLEGAADFVDQVDGLQMVLRTATIPEHKTITQSDASAYVADAWWAIQDDQSPSHWNDGWGFPEFIKNHGTDCFDSISRQAAE